MEKISTKDVTPEMISEWKEKHVQVKRITVKGNEFIIGRPTRTILDAVAKYSNDGKPNKIREVLERNCILAGDTDLFEKDINLQNTVLDKVTEMLEKLEAEEKEL